MNEHNKEGIQLIRYLCLIPVVLSTLVFFQVSQFESILYDDPVHLYENEYVATGITSYNVHWAFTETGETNLWHPVTWFSYMLDVEIFGLNNPGAHHLVNLAAHIIAVLFCYYILLYYFKNPWIALIFCCIWAIHPHRVHNVAWISQRKDVLCMCLMLGSWLAWLHSGRQLKSPLSCIALGLFLLSVMSKPSSVTLPLVLAASEVLLHGKLSKKSMLLLGLFVAISVSTACLTIYYQKQGNLNDLDQATPLVARILQMPYTLWWYVESFFYSNGALWVYSPTEAWSLWIKPTLAVIIIGALIYQFKAHRLFLFGIATSICFWLPVSGITSVSFYQVAERYSYFIHLGFILVGGAILTPLVNKYSTKYILRIASGLGLALSLATASLSYQRTSYWKNSSSLFCREAAINPRSLLAQIFLGIIEKNKGSWNEALPYFLNALELDSESGLSATHAGDCYQELKNRDMAEHYYRRALNSRVLNSSKPYQALALLLHNEERIKESKTILLRGLERFPKDTNLHMDLASIYFTNEKNYKKALEHYDIVTLTEQNNPEAKLGKVLCLNKLGKLKEAERLLIQLKTSYPKRFGNLSL